MFFEGWSFMEALYMTVITLTTVGYKEVRELDTSGQLWTMAFLTTGVGTLFYARSQPWRRFRGGGQRLLSKEEGEEQD
jgi:voltage-gated potassium channel